ncbi:MAG: alpha/beta hydrolase [Pseudomonadota bacterium]
MDLRAAPLFDDIAPGPSDGTAWWVKASDGVRLRIAAWPVDGARGTVLLFPGRTEYVEKYGGAAQAFAERGYATLAVDWRGQGLADRLVPDTRVGHVDRFSDYLLDADAALALAEALDLPKPYHLLGHSMGGGIGLSAAMQGYPVSSYAFTGPMWGISMLPVVRQIGWTLAVVGPKMGFGHKLPPSTRYENYVASRPFADNVLTRDPEMFDMMRAQIAAHPELAIGGPTLTWLREALKVTREMAARPSPAQPCLTFVGAAERIIDVDRIHTRMAAWPNGRLEVVPDAEHEVLMEVPAIRNQIFDQLVAHFDAAEAAPSAQRSA